MLLLLVLVLLLLGGGGAYDGYSIWGAGGGIGIFGPGPNNPAGLLPRRRGACQPRGAVMETCRNSKRHQAATEFTRPLQPGTQKSYRF
jgi:hypothetical protein